MFHYSLESLNLCQLNQTTNQPNVQIQIYVHVCLFMLGIIFLLSCVRLYLQVIWVCVLCRKKQELLSKTGQWMNKGAAQQDGFIRRNEPDGSSVSICT